MLVLNTVSGSDSAEREFHHLAVVHRLRTNRTILSQGALFTVIWALRDEALKQESGMIRRHRVRLNQHLGLRPAEQCEITRQPWAEDQESDTEQTPPWRWKLDHDSTLRLVKDMLRYEVEIRASRQ
jgi:hypothetical protein